MASRDITSCIEENELLNGTGSRTSIKDMQQPEGRTGGSERDLIEYLKNTSYDSFRGHEMQDAPFDNSRAGSEEDILEYEEPIFNCDLCKRRRRRCTRTEKVLIMFGIIALIVIIALAVKVGTKKEAKVLKTCETEDCINAVSSIVAAMDTKANPCEDFHQYACGGWVRETPIPPGYPVWNRFQELSYKNLYMLKNFIETHPMKGTAQGDVKRLYQSCLDESRISRSKTLQDFRSILNNISDTADTDFNFPGALIEAHKLNAWPLFRLIVGPDERNPDHNVIKIEAGSSYFPFGLFKEEAAKLLNERSANGTDANNETESVESKNTTLTPTSETNSTSKDVNDTTKVDGNHTDSGYNVVTETITKTTTTPKPANIKDSHPHPEHNVSDLVKTYLTETIALIQSFWTTTSKQQAQLEADQLLVLEKKLSLAHDIDLHIHNRTQAFNAIKINVLQTRCNMINWTPYLHGILGTESHPIKADHEVIVLHERALIEVCDIVKEYNTNATMKSILRKYILLGVARSLKNYFDMSTFQPDLDTDKEIEIEGEHWQRCTFYVNQGLGLATAAIYVNATSAHTAMTQVKDMVNHVKRAFKDYLLRKIWMDGKTKANAAAKLDEMIDKVSYPSYILNGTFIDEYYKHFIVGSDWFRNLLNWRAFLMKQMRTTLGQNYDRTYSWINPPVTVESDYSPVRNDIIFPIALFHLPIFSFDGPVSMNFGALGSLIGHEITHAFDVQGRQYDGQGRLRDWWDPVTAQLFNQTTTCMVDQYDNYKIGNMTINGEQTLEENIADNGGLRAAHVALELWLKENGGEAPLPGVNLNSRQIFYVSYAQLYCSKWKDEGIKDFLRRDPHSPGPFRIQGALSNSLSFQEVFQCSNYATYNPPKKCRVW